VTFWSWFGVIGGALGAWTALLGMVARYARAGVRAVSAHVAATTANTTSLNALTDTVRQHITATNTGLEQLDARVTRLEHAA
jgi:hypothetical protein